VRWKAKTETVNVPYIYKEGRAPMKRIKIIIRDNTLDWFERMMNSPWLDRGCWAVNGIAVIYFGLIALNVLTR